MWWRRGGLLRKRCFDPGERTHVPSEAPTHLNPSTSLRGSAYPQCSLAPSASLAHTDRSSAPPASGSSLPHSLWRRGLQAPRGQQQQPSRGGAATASQGGGRYVTSVCHLVPSQPLGFGLGWAGFGWRSASYARSTQSPAARPLHHTQPQRLLCGCANGTEKGYKPRNGVLGTPNGRG